MDLKIGLVSLGCAKNRIDSEIMLGYIEQAGYEMTPEPEFADILIINTCGFIESAKDESIETILEMAEYKKSAVCTTLVVTGCLSQRYLEELRKELPEVDIFLGVDEYDKLVGLINNRYSLPDPVQSQEKRVLTTARSTAYIRIAEGCDNHCTFCIIPKIRGKYISRKLEDIIDEAKFLKEKGVEEIIIIAQDTTQYGIDLYGEKKLPEVLSAVAELGFRWVRLLYTYPNDIDEKLLDTICAYDNICKYLDIPLQHASNKILKTMNRNITLQEINDLLDLIRKKYDDFVIRSTFIVGFPGENDDDFVELLSFLKNAKLDRVGAFAYSREEGTASAKYENQVENILIENRLERLMALQEEISGNKLLKRIGEKYEVLVEDFDEENMFYIGRSSKEVPDIDGIIAFKSDRDLDVGDFVIVEIIDSVEHDLIGKML